MLVIDCPACTAQFRIPPDVVPPEGRTLRCSTCGHTWHYVDPFRAMLNNEGGLLSPESAADPEPESPSPAADAPPTSEEVPILTDPDTPSFLQQVPDELPGSFAQAMQETAATTDLPPTGTPRKKFGGPRPANATARPPFWHRGRAARTGYMASAVTFILICTVLWLAQPLMIALIPRTQAAYNLVGLAPPLYVPDIAYDAPKLARKDKDITISGKLVNNGKDRNKIKPLRVILKTADTKEPVTTWIFSTGGRVLKPGEATDFSVTRPLASADKIVSAELGFSDIAE